MSFDFDVLVVGSGNAGQVIAQRCKAAGRRVAIIEGRELGGTCGLRGCDPKKVLVNAAELIENSSRLTGFGIEQPCRINWTQLMQFKQQFVDPLPARIEEKLQKAEIEIIRGNGEAVDSHTICVEGKNFSAKEIAICTGARPRPLKAAGDQAGVLTSDDFLSLERLPNSVVFVGGGYISAEFAAVARAAGANVTVVHSHGHLLPGFDPDVVRSVEESYRSSGMTLELHSRVTHVERTEHGSFRIALDTNGKARQLESELVVNATGRIPNVEGFADMLPCDEHGIQVDEQLRSLKYPHIWAAGDCASTGVANLTPTANNQGFVVAHNILKPDELVSFERSIVPSIVFSNPHLAQVGATEAQLVEEGAAFRVTHESTQHWSTNKRLRSTFGSYKVLLSKENDTILGASFAGPDAEEVINVLTVAMHAGMNTTQLKKTVFAYPSQSAYIARML